MVTRIPSSLLQRGNTTSNGPKTNSGNKKNKIPEPSRTQHFPTKYFKSFSKLKQQYFPNFGIPCLNFELELFA